LLLRSRLIGATSLSIAIPFLANCICPEGKNQYYALQFQTWDDDRVEYYADCFYPSKNPLFTGLAGESCKAHGGVLVKITSKAQFEFIQSMQYLIEV
jgi:hypothetical protein